MKPYTCSIFIFGNGINFFTNCLEAFNHIQKLKEFFYISNFSVTEYDPRNKYTLEFKHNSSHINPIFIQTTENYFLYTDSWEMINKTTQLMSIIYQIIELDRQENNKFLLHASGISTEKGSLVFLGGSGSGKSSIMLKLCMDYNYKMISNDKIVIGYDKYCFVEKGSKYINLRRTSTKLFTPQLDYLFNSEIKGIRWDTKHICFPNDIGIGFEEGRTKLLALVKVDINYLWVGQMLFEKYIVGKIKNTDLSSVSESFSKLIRGVEQIPIQNGNKLQENIYIPLLDNESTTRNRNRFINNLISNEKLYRLRSNIDDAVQAIVELIEKE